MAKPKAATLPIYPAEERYSRKGELESFLAMR